MQHKIFPLVRVQTQLATILLWEAVELIGRYHALVKSTGHILPVSCDAVSSTNIKLRKHAFSLADRGS
jgi:hypothetical protein